MKHLAKIHQPTLVWAFIICVTFFLLAAELSTAHFARSFLIGGYFCLSIVLGAMWLVMLHHIVGGAWGFLIRRIGENLGMTLPLLALFSLIVLANFKSLYPWADPQFWKYDSMLIHRHGWMNSWGVFIRGALFFACWIYMAFKLRQNSLAQDRGSEPLIRQNRLLLFSRGGLVAGFLTVSIAAIDWIMSREPHWYSTAFGLVLITSQALCGLSAMIIILYWYREHPQVKALISPDRVHDLGNLLLMCTVLWAYISFAQFLVIWMGNTQEEIVYYHHRNTHGWRIVTASLIIFNFSLPFAGLLAQGMKRDLRKLAGVSALLLLMQFVFIVWLIAPSGRGEEPETLYWTDFFVIPAVIAAWSALAAFWVGRTPPVPLYIPESEIPSEVKHDAQLAAD